MTQGLELYGMALGAGSNRLSMQVCKTYEQ